MTNRGHMVKRCRICGDKALGFNFNGLSCESCKAFFRRNAFKLKQFTCEKEGTCVIDQTNRKSCQRCRLAKCFHVGMKKELIVYEREHRKGQSTTAKKGPPLPCANLNPSAHNHHPTSSTSDDNLEGDSSDVSNGQTATTTTGACADGVYLPYTLFPPVELARLEEVRHAMSTEFPREASLAIVREIRDMYEGFNLVGHYVPSTVKFCKALAAFEAIKHEDQLIMLKHFFFDVLAIRFSFAYSEVTDGFPIIENEKQETAILFKVSQLSQWRNPDIYPLFQQFYRSFNYEMENDTTIRDLLASQALFSSTNNISCPEFVRYQYFVYNRLLRLYLLCKYENLEKANAKYASLMVLQRNCKYIREIVTQVYSAMEISKANPVLAEIYNLI